MIDTKRLETDAAYWRECGAPEDATHYDPVFHQFLQHSGLTGWHRWQSKSWELCHDPGPYLEDKFIPRPQSERVDGLPEWDGVSAPEPGELAVTSGGKCQVLGWDAQRNKVAVQWHDGELGVVSMAALKPLRTKEQRQRGYLAKLIRDHADDTDIGLADAILSRYNLESKP